MPRVESGTAITRLQDLHLLLVHQRSQELPKVKSDEDTSGLCEKMRDEARSMCPRTGQRLGCAPSDSAS